MTKAATLAKMTKRSRCTATHEAGHAVIAVRLKRWFEHVDVYSSETDPPTGTMSMSGALVRPRMYVPLNIPESLLVPRAPSQSSEAGATPNEPPRRPRVFDQELAEDSVIIALSGPIAESIYAKKSLPIMYTRGGLHDCNYAMEVLSDFDMKNYFRWFEQRAKIFLREYWPAIVTVADELVLRGRLSFRCVAVLATPLFLERDQADLDGEGDADQPSSAEQVAA
jgi:hypothetical protein